MHLKILFPNWIFKQWILKLNNERFCEDKSFNIQTGNQQDIKLLLFRFNQVFSKQFAKNYNTLCGKTLPDSSVLNYAQNLLSFLQNDPCGSVSALITVMTINNIKTIPRKPEDQEQIIKSLSDQNVKTMNEIVERENEETKVIFLSNSLRMLSF